MHLWCHIVVTHGNFISSLNLKEYARYLVNLSSEFEKCKWKCFTLPLTVIQKFNDERDFIVTMCIHLTIWGTIVSLVIYHFYLIQKNYGNYFVIIQFWYMHFYHMHVLTAQIQVYCSQSVNSKIVLDILLI